eukprot:2145075-Prymnesium_polylepis.1
MGARNRVCAGHAWWPRTLHETPLCLAAAAQRLWGEPRCQRGGELAQARATGGGGGARERTGVAEDAGSGAWIAGAAHVERHAHAHDLNV